MPGPRASQPSSSCLCSSMRNSVAAARKVVREPAKDSLGFVVHILYLSVLSGWNRNYSCKVAA